MAPFAKGALGGKMDLVGVQMVKQDNTDVSYPEIEYAQFIS